MSMWERVSCLKCLFSPWCHAYKFLRSVWISLQLLHFKYASPFIFQDVDRPIAIFLRNFSVLDEALVGYRSSIPRVWVKEVWLVICTFANFVMFGARECKEEHVLRSFCHFWCDVTAWQWPCVHAPTADGGIWRWHHAGHAPSWFCFVLSEPHINARILVSFERTKD